MANYSISIESGFSICLLAAKSSYATVINLMPPFLIQIKADKTYKSWNGILTLNLSNHEDGCSISVGYDVDGGDMFSRALAQGAAGTACVRFTKQLELEISKGIELGKASSIDSDVSELMKLKSLLTTGEITQDEYDLLKKKHLS